MNLKTLYPNLDLRLYQEWIDSQLPKRDAHLRAFYIDEGHAMLYIQCPPLNLQDLCESMAYHFDFSPADYDVKIISSAFTVITIKF